MLTIDCHNHIGSELLHYLHGDFPYAQQLETMVAQGLELGIRRWVVFPMVTNISLSVEAMREGRIADGDPSIVPYEWENRRMMQEIYDLFPEEGRDAIPFAMFDANRNVAGQVKALRTLREKYSFAGLKTQPTIIQSAITNLNEEGRAFLELAQEWNIPMLIHSSVLPADIWSQVHDILDIVEKTPGVRFNVAHSLRFDKAGLERLAALPNAWFDCSAHRIHCDLAMIDHPAVAPRENRFESDYSRPSQVLRDLGEAYPDKLMWGSDSPYYSFVAEIDGKVMSLRSTYAQEVAALRALPLEIQQRIGETNTLKYLGN